MYTVCLLNNIFYLLQYWHLRPRLFKLLGAVLRGVAANSNDVNFVLKGKLGCLNKDDLVSQLGQEKVKRFEIVERQLDVYFISHPLNSTCELCVLMH